MSKNNNHIHKQSFYSKIKQSFNKAANNYDANAVLQHEVGQRLVDRLDFFTLKPNTILDLGMGTGKTTRLLADKYTSGTILGLDFAPNMLTASQNNLSNTSNTYLVQSDINQLPFANNSIDLIFSNFTFQWCENITNMFTECYRVLKNNGLLFFSLPGPDTLSELYHSFQQIDPSFSHVNNFIDMHDIGDILVQTKFSHPVMDNEYFTLTYSSVTSIIKDIKSIGANTILSDNTQKHLMTKTKLELLNQKYLENFKLKSGKLPLTYEVIYGHAFKTDKPVKVKHPELSEVTVPIEKIIKK